MVTSTEHVAWCKERALEYLPDRPDQALASMMSDLGKHPDTRRSQEICVVAMGFAHDPVEIRKFIEGFN